MLKAQVNILELEQPEAKGEIDPSYAAEKEKEDRVLMEKTISEQTHNLKRLETQCDQAKQLLSEEMEKSRQLQRELSENYKQMRMLNTGSATLDHILSLGQSPKINWGIGYQGSTSQTADNIEGVKFVKNTNSAKLADQKPGTSINHVLTSHRRKLNDHRSNGCLFCCKPGHRAATCYFRKAQYRSAWMMNRCFIEPKRVGLVWIAKTDLYPNFKNRVSSRKISYDGVDKSSTLEQRPGKEIVCNMAIIQDIKNSGEESMSHIESAMLHLSNDKSLAQDFDKIDCKVAYTSAHNSSCSEIPWYFDSGCSRHMTGNRLINVYFVDGLKANLISVSQLCDEGLQVTFTKKECHAIDEKGNVVLCGLRSGNNCYMWKPSNQCMSAKDTQIDLWHKKLGHMNTHGLSRLVRAEAIRGVPSLEYQTDTVCGPCCQGKQIKVQHKQVHLGQILEEQIRCNRQLSNSCTSTQTGERRNHSNSK
ncbi:hypothetical protein N665_4947s0002 [Sinapis alba]|nr:hypothetical protein N665_4947s0002 [Sinapis alba]